MKLVGRREIFVRDRVQVLAESLQPRNDSRQKSARLVVTKHFLVRLAHGRKSYYYSLSELARLYHPTGFDPKLASFSVHPLFEDPLSDQIPSERAPEIWSRSANLNRPWMQQMQTFERTVKTRLMAAEQVRRRLEGDLNPDLAIAGGA